MSFSTITPAELKKRHAEDPSLEVIDVRMPNEFGEVH